MYVCTKLTIIQGFEYSRSDNPNRRALEAQLASLEAGKHALAFASGSAATATVLTAVGANAHVISVNDVYGGTHRYMTRVAKELQNVDVTWLDLENSTEEVILSSIRPNTKVSRKYAFIHPRISTYVPLQLLWIETPSNPTLRVIDIPYIARILSSHPSQPLLLVDNTFMSPYFQSPLLLGADVVLHSITKYINGHSDVLMGALILPEATQFSKPFFPSFLDKLRFLQNAMGAVPSPHDAWLAQRGAKTLHLRMRAHGLGALSVAKALERAKDRGLVRDVTYPGLRSYPRFHVVWGSNISEQAKSWIDGLKRSVIPGLGLDPEGRGYDPELDGIPFGGMVSFRINGGEQETNQFLASLRLFTLAESLGGVESLAEVPEKMTHGAIPPAERTLLGIGPDLIRLSVGIEDPEDLVRDIEYALESVKRPIHITLEPSSPAVEDESPLASAPHSSAASESGDVSKPTSL
jgi:cystathionine gamma-lyase